MLIYPPARGRCPPAPVIDRDGSGASEDRAFLCVTLVESLAASDYHSGTGYGQADVVCHPPTVGRWRLPAAAGRGG